MDDDEASIPLMIDRTHMAGVWANRFRVVVSRHEFTLDFHRIDFDAPAPGEAVLVARVAVGSALFLDVMRELDLAWKRYAERSLPPEVHGG